MIPGVNLYIDGYVSENNKIVKKIRRFKGHSFVKQFLQVTMKFLCNGPMTLKYTDNADKVWSTKIPVSIYLLAAVNNDNYGLVVGSSSTAVTMSDYCMASKIDHGVAAGELQYSAVILGAPTTDATSSQFVITRVFTNGSGGSVLVKEVGIVSEYRYDTWNAYCLIARDVLASTITLTNGQNLTLNYTIKATV